MKLRNVGYWNNDIILSFIESDGRWVGMMEDKDMDADRAEDLYEKAYSKIQELSFAGKTVKLI